jgi:hypothetical protein
MPATNKVIVPLDTDVTCEIVNNDDPPQLKLVKAVEGGTAVANDWLLNATANVTSDRDFSNDGGSGGFNVVYSNYTYTLSEDGPGGYASDNVWSCVDNNKGDIPFTTVDNDEVKLDLGDKVTCTITNIAAKAKITIIKQVPIGSTQDFNFTSNVTGYETFSLDDDEEVLGASPPPGDQDLFDNVNMTDILPGSYMVTEVLDPSSKVFWQLADVNCVVKDLESGNPIAGSSTWDFDALNDKINITVENEEHVECTFVNLNAFNQRTQGFYKTHTAITTHSFTSPLASAEAIGFTSNVIILGSSTTGQVIDNIKEVFGLYYASNSWASDKKYSEEKSDGTMRDADEQTYLLMIHQLLTAKLNCGLFGCAEAVEELINKCDDLYSMANVTGLKNLETLHPGEFLDPTAESCQEKLDNYNNMHGDSGLNPFEITGIPPGASPSDSRMLAEMEIIDNAYPEFDDDVHADDDQDGSPTGISRWDEVKPEVNPFFDPWPTP